MSDLFDDYNRFDSDERLDASGRRIHLDPYERYMYGIFSLSGIVSPSDGEAGHSVLLRSDGTAVACGVNHVGQCNIPELVEGVTYTHVDTGTDHTVLLASDGTAAACGSNKDGECNVPALSGGVIYTQVAVGCCYTVLLMSNGTAVVCGVRQWKISRLVKLLLAAQHPHPTR